MSTHSKKLIAVGLSLSILSLLISSFVIVNSTRARNNPPTMSDPDYWPESLTQCVTLALHATTAPSPAPALTGVGQPGDAPPLRFKVVAPAQLTDTVAGRQAHKQFVVVQIGVQYTDDAYWKASPWGYQLVDNSGGLNCIIGTPTGLLNQAKYPDISVNGPWFVQLTPSNPEATLSLVFDIDPSLVRGSYLLAYGMKWAAFDLGLT